MITVEELKEWINISSDEDDQKLSELIAGSLGYISNYCNRLFFENTADFEEVKDSLSEKEIANSVILSELPYFQQMNIQNARIKLITDWYEYRGNIVEYAVNEVADGIRRILQPFWIYKITD